MRETQRFVVIALSDNCNSFGLRGHFMVNRDGEAWEAGASESNEKQVNDILEVPIHNGQPIFAGFGFEIPEKKPTILPASLLKLVNFDGRAKKVLLPA